MQVRYGLLAEFEAAPGEGGALAAFLIQAREIAAAEDGTVTWHAFKAGDTVYVGLAVPTLAMGIGTQHFGAATSMFWFAGLLLVLLAMIAAIHCGLTRRP